MRAKMAVVSLLIAVCTGCPLRAPEAQKPVIYVDAAAPTGGDGASWSSAFHYLADAVHYAGRVLQDYGWSTTILVAEGIYYPGEAEDPAAVPPTGAPGGVMPFGVVPTMSLLGGFPSGGGTRDPAHHLTVLSGDIDKNDTVNAEGVVEDSAFIKGTNAVAVLGTFYGGDRTIPPDARAIVDGFTITAAAFQGRGAIECYGNTKATFSNLTVIGNGSGALDIVGDPAASVLTDVKDCVFRNNYSGSGGAVNIDRVPASAVFERVTFTSNIASYNGGVVHVANQSDGDVRLVFKYCTFEGNRAVAGSAGGLYLSGGLNGSVRADFANCSFFANQATSGAAIWVSGYTSKPATVSADNCEFVGNTSSYGGGAIYAGSNSNVTLTNCTLTANHAESSGGALYLSDSDPLVVNTILWDNSSGTGNEVEGYPRSATFKYCDVTGSGGSGSWNTTYGTDGGGNIDADPRFATSPSSGGDWADLSTNNYGALAPAPGSPVTDAGINALLPPDRCDLDRDGDLDERIPLDIDGRPRVNGLTVDMGAYEQ